MEILHKTSMPLGQDPFDPAYGHGLVNAVDKMQSIVGRRQGSLVEIIAETATIHEEAFRAWRHPSRRVESLRLG